MIDTKILTARINIIFNFYNNYFMDRDDVKNAILISMENFCSNAGLNFNPYTDLNERMRWSEEFRMDSLDLVEMCVNIENDLGIRGLYEERSKLELR